MRTVGVIVTGLFAMLIGSTTWAAACDGFTDVDSSASYCTAVTYLKDRGVTLGCTGTAYCPDAFVTRAQMALFLQRMGKGGASNTLGDPTGVIGGGDSNNTLRQYSTVGGGISNTAQGTYSSVVGGEGNAGLGGYSTVLGGGQNTASGQVSIAAGFSARADQDDCVVFSLWNASLGMSCLGTTNIFRIGGTHGFSVDYHTERPDGGGYRWVAIGDLFDGQTIATWNGAYLSDAGVWTSVSDRAVKEDFTPIDDGAILDRVVQMPVERWRYKAEPAATHIGPVAQDFYSAFNVGADDKHITPIDEGGVALAAIQGLYERERSDIAAKDLRIAALEREMAEVRAQIAALTH